MVRIESEIINKWLGSSIRIVGNMCQERKLALNILYKWLITV